jgi:hypothetical protein
MIGRPHPARQMIREQVRASSPFFPHARRSGSRFILVRYHHATNFSVSFASWSSVIFAHNGAPSVLSFRVFMTHTAACVLPCRRILGSWADGKCAHCCSVLQAPQSGYAEVRDLSLAPKSPSHSSFPLTRTQTPYGADSVLDPALRQGRVRLPNESSLVEVERTRDGSYRVARANAQLMNQGGR